MQRRHQNHGGYGGERIDIRAVLAAMAGAAKELGWRGEIFHGAGDFQWPAWQREAADPTRQRRVYISAGIHGDEPAGPLAMLELMQANLWPSDVAMTLVPCLNPAGFAGGRRENADGVDLNRDYLAPRAAEIAAHVRWLKQQEGFDLCLCLHEDWEAQGFYLYELNPDSVPSLAGAMIRAVSAGCPIDRSAVIEGRPASGGIIRPNLDPALRPAWPESFWLIQNRTRLSYTLEAPSDFPLATRVTALVAAVRSALSVPGEGTPVT